MANTAVVFEGDFRSTRGPTKGRLKGRTNLLVPPDAFGSIQELTYTTFAAALAQEQAEGDLLEPTVITDNVWNKSPLEVKSKIEAVDPSATSAAEIIRFILDNLDRRSPYRTGRYLQSHRVLYNGQPVTDINKVTLTKANDTLIFTNFQPYAKKIEQGLSSQAAQGVYRLTAMRANNTFRRLIRVKFTYRPIESIGYGGLGNLLAAVPSRKGPGGMGPGAPTIDRGLQVRRRVGRKGERLARPQAVTHVYPVIMVWPQLVGGKSRRPSNNKFHAKMRWKHKVVSMPAHGFGGRRSTVPDRIRLQGGRVI